MVEGGKRKEEWSPKNLLPISGKLIPEFDRRRNIRDMFSQKPSLSSQKSFAESEEMEAGSPSGSVQMAPPPISSGSEKGLEGSETGPVARNPVPVAGAPRLTGSKRAQKPEAVIPTAKRSKSAVLVGAANGSPRGQQSLKGFFLAKSQTTSGLSSRDADTDDGLPPKPKSLALSANDSQVVINQTASSKTDSTTPREQTMALSEPSLTMAIDEESAEASRQSWGKLFSKPVSPKCEHGEPCKTMLTKKPGVNCGRSFWICARPLGPSGNKERNTQWRCGTFIWASDWTSSGNV